MQPLGGGVQDPRVLHPLRTHLKLDIDAEKVLIFTSCGPEKPNHRAGDSVMKLKLKCDGCNACVYLALIASRFAITVDLEGHKVGPDFFPVFLHGVCRWSRLARYGGLPVLRALKVRVAI